MKIKNKDIPHFKSENEEREFWAKQDSTEYIIANKKDVPYQSLVKIYLSEKVREEMEIRA